jgi:ribosomal protein L34E
VKSKKSEDDYTDKFIGCQESLKQLISRLPVGIQNWSYDKTVKYKNHLKECEAKIKLQPKSRHVEFIRIEQCMRDMEQYYK